MEQGLETECHQPYMEPKLCCDDSAFSPAIIEIGFIDEDEVGSDLSDLSTSEEDKVESSRSDAPPKANETPPQGDAPFSENSDSYLASRSVPPEEVPNKEVVQQIHSNQTNISEISTNPPNSKSENCNDHQNALQSSNTGTNETHENDSCPQPMPQSENCNLQTLEESMLSLSLSLEDRSTLSAFEKLSKKNNDESMEIAKLPENAPKNRYKDVLPYDSSRVSLAGGNSGDYINASFVQMCLPHPRKPNEYIAAQGPLPQTCDDFWQMVWEQQCGIVVMVTPLKERNRAKCHQYWPDLYLTTVHNDMQVTCFSETTSKTCITRDFLLINPVLNEERHVMQLQYVNWPDHGVPEDSTDFLEFVQHLRELRRDVGGYVVVHCSAGVGRTGVLILMETALGYIDADEPVYPIELVKRMRDQRVMMVQTVVQYKFICEALLKAYNDRCGNIKPDD